ncbi:hypothetical protein D3C87_191550 [compost metagenome]
MKKLVLMLSILFIVGCSNEESGKHTQTPDNKTFRLKTLAGAVYPDFSTLLNTLYGTSYSLVSQQTFKDGVEDFKVHTVRLGATGTGSLAGYFIKNTTTGETVYLDYHPTTGTADMYHVSGPSTYKKDSYNLTIDPQYFSHGLSPNWEPVPKTKFWGWGGYDGRDPCLPIPDSDPPACGKIVYKTYYVFWLALDRENATVGNTPGGEPLREPCDCI